MVELAVDADRSHNLHEKSLRLPLAEMARSSHREVNTINEDLEEGWKQGIDGTNADNR